MKFLKKLLSFLLSNGFAASIFLILLSRNVQGTDGLKFVWFSNYEEALHESRSQDKCLLLFFNGSDWSPWGMKLKKEIFRNKVFLSQLSKNFVCLEVDFPSYMRQPNEVVEQNRRLRNVFSVEEFPSIILIDPQEREIFRFSGVVAYDSPEELGSVFLKILEDDRLLHKVSKRLEKLSVHELKKYYHLSEEIRSKEIAQIVLQKGVNLGDDFFLSEKFRLLLDSGRMDTDECQEIKRLLLDSGRRNLPENCFTIALLEFQELVERYKSGNEGDPEVVLNPLKNYLSKFGDSDDERRWRIEMMLAQFYLDSDLLSSALKHAERAFDRAPLEMKDRVFQSLSYIRNRL